MLSSMPSVMGASKASPPPRVLIAYGLFLGLAGGVWHFVANGEFSSILTMAEMLQCFALVTLAMQVVSTRSAAGISARSLTLEAAALCCRLSSTTWLNGYLPVDASGDWFYQAVDVCALAVTLWLLHEVMVKRRSTYQADEDTLPIGILTTVCTISAFLLHADMNDRPIFDSLWLAGLFLGVLAVLPQLWLMTRSGGGVEALTSHYIAMMAVGRLLSGIFMWHARRDITCIPWVTGWNHAIWAILGAHLLHMILLSDFAYIYIKAVMTRGLDARIEMDFSESCGV